MQSKLRQHATAELSDAAGPCVEVLEELRRRGPGVALLVLASQADERVERLARAAGAHCYVQGGAELVREADLRAWAARQVAAARRGPGLAAVPEARATGPPPCPDAPVDPIHRTV